MSDTIVSNSQPRTPTHSLHCSEYASINVQFPNEYAGIASAALASWISNDWCVTRRGCGMTADPKVAHAGIGLSHKHNHPDPFNTFYVSLLLDWKPWPITLVRPIWSLMLHHCHGEPYNMPNNAKLAHQDMDTATKWALAMRTGWRGWCSKYNIRPNVRPTQANVCISMQSTISRNVLCYSPKCN